MSKLYKIKHLLSASSSSVYGNSKKFPLEERFITSFPIQFYAATKKSNEVMAFYSHLFKIPITMLDFLQYMVLLVDLIWLHFYLQKKYMKIKLFKYLIKVITVETSLILMILFMD